MELRTRRVVVTLDGDRVRIRAPEGALDTTLTALAKAHRDAIERLVRDAWWPADRPRPSVMALGTRYGAAATTPVLKGLGLGLAQRTPSWEEIFVVALQVEPTTPLPAPSFSPTPMAHDGDAVPSFVLRERLGWSIEKFNDLCRRVIGHVGPATAEDDIKVLAAMAREVSP